MAAILCLSPAPTATLAFLGDVMLGRGVAAAHTSGGWETALAPISTELQAASLALANLESLLTSAPLLPVEGETGKSLPYDLRAGPQGLRTLLVAGIDLVSIANNHTYDSGPQGLADTRRSLVEAGILPVGPGGLPVYRQAGGLTLAFLAYDDINVRFGLEEAAEAVTTARRSGALVFVSIHWGSEYVPAPNPRQQAVALTLANAGAAVIWGHHPHVRQPVKWVQGEGQSRPALVAYSLGNALFDQTTPPAAQLGALLRVTVDREGVLSAEIIPFEIDPRSGIVVSSLAPVLLPGE
ncbi:MAG: CapA family protein [Chloroflexota bacterium]|nr:MAG: CapA family protein [Chloroflexota bacterium]